MRESLSGSVALTGAPTAAPAAEFSAMLRVGAVSENLGGLFEGGGTMAEAVAVLFGPWPSVYVTVIFRYMPSSASTGV